MANESYELRLTASAKHDILRLDKQVARRIIAKLLELAQDAPTAKHKALTGNLSGLFSLRVGSYRALYLLKHDKHLLVVEQIGHRRDIYDE